MYTYFFIAVTKGLKTPQSKRQQWTDRRNERIRIEGGIRKR